MDRPSRKTKAVNYRESNNFDDDDDDFAEAKPPPNKRIREDRKSSSQENSSQSAVGQKSRKPLDEKLLDRDLEAAITLSLLNNSPESNDRSPVSKDVTVKLPADENTDPAPARLSNCSVDSALFGLDKITSQTESPKVSRNGKSAAEKKREEDDDDDDYRPKLTPDSESDEDFSEAEESEDEEFTVKKVGKSKKKKDKVMKEKTSKKSPTASKNKTAAKTMKTKQISSSSASTPVRSPPPPPPPSSSASSVKLASRKPPPSSSVSSPRPAVSVSPAGGSKVPKWNPPGQVGRSPSSSQSAAAVKSPGAGLRLGLSRRVRVKPLHPSVASH